MTLLERIKNDVTTAMKAGERDRVGALRLVLSELQKNEKEGSADEVAVLRREHKRRQESARAFRDGGREDLAVVEDAEAEMISGYLPAEMSDEELTALVEDAVRASGATTPQDLGKVMKAVMPSVGGRADGRRISEKVKEALNN
jgi:uncharacterized protein